MSSTLPAEAFTTSTVPAVFATPVFWPENFLDLVHIYAELIGEVILGNVQRIFDLSHRFNCGSNIVHIIICTAAAAAGKRGAHKAN